VERARFYVTTPIYYPSADLHIGHAYTSVCADALSRFHRMCGDDVYFLTGTDEHGDKIARAAAAAGEDPQAYVDRMAQGVRHLWRTLRVEPDGFIRTTDPSHEAAVQEIFRRLRARGDIYLGEYEGLYCTSDEAFVPEGQQQDGACPVCGGPLERVREPSYFFRLSAYAPRLLELYRDQPDFVQPPSRRNEMIRFVEAGLADLSVSRVSVRWGVPVPDDPEHVIYVWIDALSNYITALGYPWPADGSGGVDGAASLRRFWPADVHLMGKEIVRFHAVIWPAMLMALDLPLPRRVYGHGWLLLEGAKMSKSRGNVVDPLQLVATYGVDAVRHYLLREVPFGADGSYTEDALRLRINVDLANDLGNLVHRTVAMVARFCGGHVPAPTGASTVLPAAARAAVAEVDAAMRSLRISDAVDAVLRLVGEANRTIDREAPWALRRTGDPRLGDVMYDLAETLRVTAILLVPFLVDTPAAIWRRLGLAGDPAEAGWAATDWGGLAPGTAVAPGEPLFRRLEQEAAAADATTEAADGAEARSGGPEIDVDTFARLDLRLVTVLSARRVEGTERLLVLEVDAGENRPRQVISGIARHYAPEALVGRQVAFVANLKPTRIRGLLSEGMVLAATGPDGDLSLLSPDRALGAGSRIR
jgi:methionyl-tRNA synthetase